MKQVIVTILIAAVTAFVVTSLKPQADVESAKQSESVAERVARTGVLRCGYNTEPPMLSIDANTGDISGVVPDVLGRVAELMEWQIEWTEQVGWTEMAAGLVADRYDLACNGKWIFASQTRGGVQFTVPLYFTATYAYGRIDESRFDDQLSQLNDKKFSIVTIDGEFNYYVAKSRFPKARRVELPALIDKATAIENVMTNKADVIFLAAFEADDYIANNPGKLKRLTPEPITVFDTALMFKAGEVEFAAMLDAALRQLKGDGYVDDALNRYGVDEAATLRVADPYKLPN